MLAFNHQPVLLREVLDALAPRGVGLYLDGTVGGGGHAVEMLRAGGPGARLLGFDRDAMALEASRDRLREFGGRVRLVHGRFDEMAQWVAAGECDAVLFDLGVSSPQLEVAGRGFSFRLDGPLDMRFDARQELTAASLVNTASAAELEAIFRDLGGEPQARRLARAVVAERGRARIESTCHLAGLIERAAPRGGARIHPATRVFQALRIAVNDELAVLRRGLTAALAVLRSGGRLAVISFHSGEDRVVKEFGRNEARDYAVNGPVDIPELRVARAPRMRIVTRRPIEPGVGELGQNPRSRSARLRVFEKI